MCSSRCGLHTCSGRGGEPHQTDTSCSKKPETQQQWHSTHTLPHASARSALFTQHGVRQCPFLTNVACHITKESCRVWAMTEASSSPSVLNLHSLDQLEFCWRLTFLYCPLHNTTSHWIGTASLTARRSLTPKKKNETGCYTQNPKTVVPGWVLPLFSLGYPGLWDCSPFLHRHTNVEQLDSGIAVHSTNTQTNTEQLQIIHAHQFCNRPKRCA